MEATPVAGRAANGAGDTVKVALGAGAVATAVLATIAGGPIVGLMILVGVVGAVTFTAFPGVLFAAYLLLAFYKAAAQPFSPVDLTVLLGFANALQILPLVREHRPRGISLAGVVLWSALTLLILAGVLYAPEQDLALDRAVRWWTLTFLPILPAAIRAGSDPRFVRQFVWSFFVMGAITVLTGLGELSRSDRLTVFATNTIQVARAALLVPIIAFAFVMRGEGRPKTVATMLLVPVALVVAVASGSRGPLAVFGLMALVGTAAYLWRRPGWKTMGIVGLVTLATLLAISVLGSSLPAASLERFGLLGQFVTAELSGDGGTIADTSSGTRVTLFRLALDLFAERPLLGTGTAGFEAIGPRYLSPAETERYPHNFVLQFGAEFGLVGLALLFGLLFLTMTRPLPDGAAPRTVRLLVAFFFLNALLSGDTFSDREAWGLLVLVLVLDSRPSPSPTTTTSEPSTGRSPTPNPRAPLSLPGLARGSVPRSTGRRPGHEAIDTR